MYAYLLAGSIVVNVVLVAIIVIIQWELLGGLPYIKRSSCSRNCNEQLWKANQLRINQVNMVSHKCCSDSNLTSLKDRKILCGETMKACPYTTDALKKGGVYTDSHIVRQP